MSILVSGLDFNTAPVALREQVGFNAEQIATLLPLLQQQASISEVVILSTCNRVEVYYARDSVSSASPWQWLCEYHHLDQNQFEPVLYHHSSADAVRHIMQVACGLGSLVLGETQILGQVKQAWQYAVNAGSTGILLNRLFQQSFRVAKTVRSTTAISHSPVSVAFAAVRLAQRIFSEEEQLAVMLIGAGEMNTLAARHFREQGVKQMIFANRTLEYAQHLAAPFSGAVIPFSAIPEYLPQVDVVFSCTGSQLPVLGKGAFESALRQRRRRPMLLLDIAVPRDIEPEVQQLEDIYLYTIDDLQEMVQENIQNRQQAAIEARRIIDDAVIQFIHWLQSLDAVTTIKALRQHAADLQQQVAVAALARLQKGAVPEQVIQDALRNLTSKLLHNPCVNLRAASMEGRTELIEMVQELFALLLVVDDSENQDS